MGLFSRLFRANKDVKPKTIKEIKQEANINYHTDLVGRLKDEHQELFGLYGELVEMVNTQNFSDLSAKLQEFKMALQAHVLVENVQFYVYLQNKFHDDPSNLEFIKDLRLEMNSIARAVVNFTKKYQSVVFTDEVKSSFVKDLNGIGKTLTQRVDVEEKQLYTLYIP